MKIIITSILLLISPLAFAQQVDLTQLQPDQPYENIHVQKIKGDSLVTSFVIWIKKEVPLHYHAEHSEHVLMLEGEGVLTLNGKEIKMRPGSFVFVPKGSHHAFRTSSAIPAKVLSVQAPEFKGEDRVKVE